MFRSVKTSWRNSNLVSASSFVGKAVLALICRERRSRSLITNGWLSKDRRSLNTISACCITKAKELASMLPRVRSGCANQQNKGLLMYRL